MTCLAEQLAARLTKMKQLITASYHDMNFDVLRNSQIVDFQHHKITTFQMSGKFYFEAISLNLIDNF